MRCNPAWIGVCVAVILACAVAQAPAADDSAVLPFLDDNTLLVARIDEAALDMKANAKWFISRLESSKVEARDLEMLRKMIVEGNAEAEKWTDKFRAAGGKRMYVVLGMSDMRDGPFIVVPLEGGANGNALAELFKGTSRERAETIGAAVVFGHEATRKRLKEAPAGKPRPELAEAMAAAGSAPARVVLFPSDSIRQMLEGAMPKLPNELGGGPATTLSQGVKWATLSIKPPEEPSIDLIVQAKDAASASELLKLEEKAVAWVGELGKKAPFDVKTALALIMPKVEGDRLHITLNSGQIDNLIVSMVVPTMIKTRETAAMASSQNNVRQLLQGCEIYSIEHQGKWPDSLDQIEKYVGDKEQRTRLMTARPRGGATPHYTYRKPAHPNDNAAETLVIYESFADGPALDRIVAGYSDGHVDTLSPAELKKRLEVGEK